MKQWVAPAHLALTLVIILWNVSMAGRIAQLRQESRPFATLTGFAGLMLIPAFIIAIATTTLITGRGISAVDWVWPLTVVLVTCQALYALGRRLVHPLWGYPIAFYDALLAIASVTRLLSAHGVEIPRPLLVLMAAQVDALSVVTADAAIVSPLFLHVPLISPALPELTRRAFGIRFAVAGLALAWFGSIVAEIPRADAALASYESHANDLLTERPNGFVVGLKVLPDVTQPPVGAALKTDLETANWAGVRALNFVFVPGANPAAIDSVARTVDRLVRDSVIVVATIGYSGKLLPELRRARLDPEQRLETLEQVIRRLRPDIVVPAQDPYGIGARIHGRLPVETWQNYHARAAALVKQLRPRTRVAYAVSAFDGRDSTLYAWAAGPNSPIDVVGFSFYPSRLGARSMDAGFRAADRWLRVHPPKKPHWVLGAGGYPLAHGEASHERAVWAALAWATARPDVQGLIVTSASDYGQATGIRAPAGRLRAAATSVRKSVLALRESVRDRVVSATP
ncbi:MAG: hypothetical protein ACRENU_10825 [Gemmatimonadaceae bacterium]